MSVKECELHKQKRRKILRGIFAGILIFLLLVLLVILIVWAILRPTKPRFILQDATVYVFNASIPNFLTSTMQVTLASRNPNDDISVYYDRLDVYASYRNQQITPRTSIPPTFQGHKEVDIWSPFLYGTAVPIAPYNSVALQQEQQNGALLLVIKIDGRVRWKVGAFTSGRYRLYVRCPAYITFGSTATGTVVGENAVKYQLASNCKVSV